MGIGYYNKKDIRTILTAPLGYRIDVSKCDLSNGVIVYTPEGLEGDPYQEVTKEKIIKTWEDSVWEHGETSYREVVNAMDNLPTNCLLMFNIDMLAFYFSKYYGNDSTLHKGMFIICHDGEIREIDKRDSLPSPCIVFDSYEQAEFVDIISMVVTYGQTVEEI